MTVKELIQELKKQPQDAKVIVRIYDNDWSSASRTSSVETVAPNKYNEVELSY